VAEAREELKDETEIEANFNREEVEEDSVANRIEIKDFKVCRMGNKRNRYRIIFSKMEILNLLKKLNIIVKK